MDISSRGSGKIKVAVPRLNRIANFDDLDPLSSEPDVTVEIVEAGRALPGDADLILIPGSKSTIADLAHLRAQGWDIDIKAHINRGGRVLGICGGYQMLGREIIDDLGLEGAPSTVAGLGLLDISTHMKPEKRLAMTNAVHVTSGTPVTGYEIHLGETTGPDCANAWLRVDNRLEGAADKSGRISGCYLHGLFTADHFRHHFLGQLGMPNSNVNYEHNVEKTLDSLARHVEAHLDLDALLSLAETVIR
jgi:adenosylcobyric acid synthase